jgi:hypothetical protein
MRHRAERGNSERDFARINPCHCCQIDCGLDWHSCVHNQHRRVERDEAHWREIAQRVVGCGTQMRIDHRYPRGGEVERVAVGFRLRNILGADRAVGAGLVLDDYDLPERHAQLIGEKPRHEVGGAAG